MSRRVDVVIAGAGLAGLSLALALRQALGPTFGVVVADPALEPPATAVAEDPRAYAMAAGARHLLEALGVWPAVASVAQPILAMDITDSRLSDVLRPGLLHFAGELSPGEPFAHIVESAPLLEALRAASEAAGVHLHPGAIRGMADGEMRALVDAEDGSGWEARLLVAADGRASHLRERAGIASLAFDYPQSAIVTTVAHERDHEGRAVQHFLPGGPFAMLPLTGRRTSVVWTETTGEAARIVALDDAAFHDELEQRFGLERGEIALAGPRRAFPLRFLLARSFVSGRLALIGDAAHVIHPLAGQGLNMGLRDVAALAEAIVDSARLGLDPGGGGTLARYQRWRRFDSLAMGVATDGLNRLFSNRSDVLRGLRDLGLGLVERAPSLKAFFIREAAGLTGDVPRLMRGEAL